MLLCLVTALFVVYFSMPRYHVTKSECEECFVVLENARIKEEIDKKPKKETTQIKKVFVFKKFDPNLVSKDELIAMGMSEKITENIIKYRSKGGKFKKSEDIEKIYGIDKEWVVQAKPWLVFDSKYKTTAIEKEKNTTKKILIDLNLVDSASLVSVKGIGPVTAKKILKYRELLGGFVDVNQLNEVYGFSELSIRNIHEIFVVSPDFQPRQIIINKTDYKTIFSHPYLGKKITSHMKSSGRHLQTFDELASLTDTTKINLSILKRYVTFD